MAMTIGASVSVSLIITVDVIDIAPDVASLYGLVKITFSTEYSKSNNIDKILLIYKKQYVFIIISYYLSFPWSILP